MGLRIHRKSSRTSASKIVTLDGDGGFVVPEHVACFTFYSVLGETVNLGYAIGAADYIAGIVIQPGNVPWDETVHKSFAPGTKLYLSGNINPIVLKIRL